VVVVLPFASEVRALGSVHGEPLSPAIRTGLVEDLQVTLVADGFTSLFYAVADTAATLRDLYSQELADARVQNRTSDRTYAFAVIGDGRDTASVTSSETEALAALPVDGVLVGGLQPVQILFSSLWVKTPATTVNHGITMQKLATRMKGQYFSADTASLATAFQTFAAEF